MTPAVVCSDVTSISKNTKTQKQATACTCTLLHWKCKKKKKEKKSAKMIVVSIENTVLHSFLDVCLIHGVCLCVIWTHFILGRNRVLNPDLWSVEFSVYLYLEDDAFRKHVLAIERNWILPPVSFRFVALGLWATTLKNVAVLQLL